MGGDKTYISRSAANTIEVIWFMYLTTYSFFEKFLSMFIFVVHPSQQYDWGLSEIHKIRSLLMVRKSKETFEKF